MSAFLLAPPDREKIKAAYDRIVAQRKLLGSPGGGASASMPKLATPTPVKKIGTTGGAAVSAGFQSTTLPIATPAGAYGAQYGGGVPPSTMKVGQSVNVAVSVQNTSSRTWPPNGVFRLAFHWYRNDGRQIVKEGDRTVMPVSVAPGATINLIAKLTAPTDKGAAVLRWDMVEENVAWFSDKLVPMSAPHNVNVVP